MKSPTKRPFCTTLHAGSCVLPSHCCCCYCCCCCSHINSWLQCSPWCQDRTGSDNSGAEDYLRRKTNKRAGGSPMHMHCCTAMWQGLNGLVRSPPRAQVWRSQFNATFPAFHKHAHQSLTAAKSVTFIFPLPLAWLRSTLQPRSSPLLRNNSLLSSSLPLCSDGPLRPSARFLGSRSSRVFLSVFFVSFLRSRPRMALPPTD